MNTCEIPRRCHSEEHRDEESDFGWLEDGEEKHFLRSRSG